MFDNTGFCSKRRSPSCTSQTTRSTADYKIIESLNCLRHHEPKRQAHLSGNDDFLSTRSPRMFAWLSTTGLGALGRSKPMSTDWTLVWRKKSRWRPSCEWWTFITREFQLFFCLFAKLLDNIYVSLLEILIFIFVQVKTSRKKGFFVVLWSLFTSQNLLPSGSSALFIGDLVLIAVEEKG